MGKMVQFGALKSVCTIAIVIQCSLSHVDCFQSIPTSRLEQNTPLHNHPWKGTSQPRLPSCHLAIKNDAQEEETKHQCTNNDEGCNPRRDFFHQIGRVGSAVALGLTTSLNLPPQSATAAQGYIPDMVGGFKKPKGVGGLPQKIRSVGDILDELQRDLMQERWDLVEKYPTQLRSFVPVFTTYTDAAFPSDAPTDKGLRVALRYEVGRLFASVERLKQATSRKSLDEAYVAFSDMSLHFDRYLHVGGLYTYYDATITNEPYFKGISESSLVFADPKRDPPLVRDLIVLIKGPDMGKTGILIGKYSDGSNNCIVKLDRFMGLREIRVVDNKWVAKRLGEQDPDDVFLIRRK